MANSKRQKSSRASFPHKKDEKRTGGKRAVSYRDGELVADKPADQQAWIWKEHADPNHPDYNPNGKTLQAAEGGADFIDLAIKDRAAMQAGRSAGGKASAAERGKETRERVTTAYDNLSEMPERNKASVIVERTGVSRSQVGRILKKYKARMS